MKNIRYLSGVFILIAVVLAAGGCVQANPSSPPNTPTNTPGNTATPTFTATGPGGELVTLPSFHQLIDVVEHAVVAIETETVINSGFIQRTVQGAGSGWIIDPSGIIVTNHHVIENAKTITVILNDGTTYTPVSVEFDATADIAILKINAGNLPALPIADVSRLFVGDWVVAVGNALGQGISAKDGIVSRLGVDIQVSQTETYHNLIETNAAINPGNSGGPLVNLAGGVVGITSLKLSAAGIEGMGYAINIAEALPVIQRLSQ
jgi:serine protease Do